MVVVVGGVSSSSSLRGRPRVAVVVLAWPLSSSRGSRRGGARGRVVVMVDVARWTGRGGRGGVDVARLTVAGTWRG